MTEPDRIPPPFVCLRCKGKFPWQHEFQTRNGTKPFCNSCWSAADREERFISLDEEFRLLRRVLLEARRFIDRTELSCRDDPPSHDELEQAVKEAEKTK